MNKIGWCDKTVNPVTGCPNGCEYCYARDMNNRFNWVDDFSKPQFFPERLKGFQTKKPQIIFIDSMSDIAYWSEKAFERTTFATLDYFHNVYLALTKNIAKALYLFDRVGYQHHLIPNIYLGATVTNDEDFENLCVTVYEQTLEHKRNDFIDFISFEPLCNRIDLAEIEIKEGRYPLGKWWIIGDLTKHGKPQGVTQKSWVNEMVAFCREYNIPIFMKDSIKELMGEDFVQEFPKAFINKLGKNWRKEEGGESE